MDTIEPLSQEEMEQRLQALAKTDREAVVLFASRCAQRLFPLLAGPGHFDYWPEHTRLKYLLAVWWAANVNKVTDLEDTFVAAARAAAARAAAARAAAARAAAFAADARAAAFAADARAAARAAAFAADAAFAAFAAFAADARADAADLLILEMDGPNVLQSVSLWQDQSPGEDYLTVLEKYFPHAIEQLIEQNQQSDPKGCELAQQIVPLYMGLYQGKPDQERIDIALEGLSHYFQKQNSDAQEKSKEEALSQEEIKDEKESSEALPDTAIPITEYTPGHRHNSHKEATEDRLQREPLASALADLLCDPNNKHHQTIGLLGHWGVGKSTLIELLKRQLLARQPIQPFLFARFNAWEYEHTDNLQAGIAQEMISALTSLELASEARGFRQTISNFARWLGWRMGGRVALILRFAVALHGWKLLKPTFYLLIAALPMLSLLFSDALSLVTDWLTTILPEGVKAHAGKVTVSLSGIWLAGGLLPVWKEMKTLLASPKTKEWLTYLKLPDYAKHLGTIPVMRDHISKLAKVRLSPWNFCWHWPLGRQKRLLYVVDDLDRCSDKGIVKVLEAVRLVLDIEQVTVVIAVDQRIALAALALHYEKLAGHHPLQHPHLIARDYLAKIIHLPVILSEPDQDSLQGYLEHLWQEEDADSNKRENHPTETVTKESKQQIEAPPPGSNKVAAAKAQRLAEQDATGKEGQEAKTAGLSQESLNQKNPQSPANQTSDPVPVKDKTEDKTETETHKVIGLSEWQKKAFAYWLNHFGMSNPRQVKRLYNSYCLLRNYLAAGDELAVGEDLDETLKQEENGNQYAYPMMVTLFTLEYLNHLEDAALRCHGLAY